MSFHEGAIAKLRFNGATTPEENKLQRGLKQGSVLSPVLFNIFMGAIIKSFEKTCTIQVGQVAEEIGIKVSYNLAGDLLDQKRLNKKTAVNSSFTLLDVLYADDCVLFSNSVRAMQSMVTTFDSIATAFGMEISIDKTKVICNEVSRRGERNFSTATTNKATNTMDR